MKVRQQSSPNMGFARHNSPSYTFFTSPTCDNQTVYVSHQSCKYESVVVSTHHWVYALRGVYCVSWPLPVEKSICTQGYYKAHYQCSKLTLLYMPNTSYSSLHIASTIISKCHAMWCMIIKPRFHRQVILGLHYCRKPAKWTQEEWTVYYFIRARSLY